jgi:hypothetical protein
MLSPLGFGLYVVVLRRPLDLFVGPFVFVVVLDYGNSCDNLL